MRVTEILLHLRSVQMERGRDDALGFSLRSWMMYSPRSVSTGVMPLFSRCAFSSISSDTMDLPLVTVFAPAAVRMAITAARASSGVRAQCTWPPFAVTLRSKVSSRVSRLASA